MPIAGITASPDFLPIGVLRKGAPKPQKGPGRELPYWRFQPAESPLGKKAAANFTARYGAEPDTVRVYLPFDDVDQVFSAYCEAWTAGQLGHRCDGEYVYERDRTGALIRTATPCPHKSWPRDREGRCKPAGRLKVIIDGLGLFAYATVLTTSIIDIAKVTNQLAGIQALTGGRLAGIPLDLMRVPEKISTPSGPDGKRARREKFMIHLAIAPDYANAVLAATARAGALAGPMGHASRALPAPAGRVIDADTGEILTGRFALPEATNSAEPADEYADEYADEAIYEYESDATIDAVSTPAPSQPAPAKKNTRAAPAKKTESANQQPQAAMIQPGADDRRVRMIQKIQRLWSAERTMHEQKSIEYKPLDPEAGADLAQMADSELEALGAKIRARLDLMENPPARMAGA